MITRGTTPTIVFKYKHNDEYVNLSSFDEVYFTIKGNCNQLDIPKDRMQFDDELVSATLTQEETLALNHKINASIQIRLKLANGGAFASQKKTVDVKDVIKEGVI